MGIGFDTRLDEPGLPDESYPEVARAIIASEHARAGFAEYLQAVRANSRHGTISPQSVMTGWYFMQLELADSGNNVSLTRDDQREYFIRVTSRALAADRPDFEGSEQRARELSQAVDAYDFEQGDLDGDDQVPAETPDVF